MSAPRLAADPVRDRAPGSADEPTDMLASSSPEAVDRGRRRSVVSTLVSHVVPLGLLLATFVVLARLAARPISNGDTFFHVRFGEEFLTGAWSLRHPGSVTTMGTADWLPTQWLPQLILAQLDRSAGLAGVAWFGGFQFIVLAVALYLACRRWADPAVAAPLTIVAVIASTSGLSTRPQVLSYAMVAVTAAAWLAARDSGRAPWALVPLTWVWATYHGMWPTGLVIGVVAVVGLALDGQARGRDLARYAAIPALCAVAAALTPLGPRLYSAVVAVNARSEYFDEWRPAHVTSPGSLALLALLGLTVIVLARREEPTPWTLVLLIGLAAAWGVYSSRTVPVAAAIAAPLAALALQGLVGPPTRPHRVEKLSVLIGAVTTLAALAVVTPHTAADPAPQPSWVDPALSVLPSGTPILNNSLYGGYLMWAYPQLDVVISGYGDIYTDRELERNADIEDVKRGWDDAVRSTGARIAVLSTDSALAYALEGAGWTIGHSSADIEYLTAPADW